MLDRRCPDREMRGMLFAHSGASTGYKPDGSIESKREPRINGEVPALYPTILQVNPGYDAHVIALEAVDIVLLDAGVNNVHITSNLYPTTTPHF